MSLRWLIYSIQRNSLRTILGTSQNCFQCSRTINIGVYSQKFKWEDSPISKKLCGLQVPSSTSVRYFSMSHKLCSEKQRGLEYEDGKLLYLGGSVGQSIKRVQTILYSVGAMTTVGAALLWGHADSEVMKCMVLTWVFLFGFLNPAIYYKFTRRYVNELYHDKENDKYIALVASPFIKGHSRVVFTPHDCRMPEKMSTFISFLVKGNPIFINSDEMNYGAYMKMLRYASEFDYENPDRQQQYKDAVQASIERIGKNNNNKSEEKDKQL